MRYGRGRGSRPALPRLAGAEGGGAAVRLRHCIRGNWRKRSSAAGAESDAMRRKRPRHVAAAEPTGGIGSAQSRGSQFLAQASKAASRACCTEGPTARSRRSTSAGTCDRVSKIPAPTPSTEQRGFGK